MNRTQWLLSALVVIELAVGGYFVARRLGRPTPPLPDLSAVDPVSAEEIRGLAADCRTAGQWARLGEVYLATGFFPQGEACLREASALAPADTDLAFKHGFALERIGKLKEANAKYKAAAGLNHPRAKDCWYYAGRNHLRLGRPRAAAEAFGRAGDLPAARYELARLDLRAGRLAEAEATARRLAGQFPDAYPVASLRYRLALARDDRPSADALADQFARARGRLPGPFDTEIDWIFGVANGIGRDRLFRDAGREARAGRVANAEAKLRSALAAGWSPDIADKLADVLFARGRTGEAVEVLAEAVARGGPSFELLWRLGQAYNAAGQPARSRELWERAGRMATGPAARDLWHDLAVHYDRAGEKDKAKTFHARAYLAAGMESLAAGQPGAAAQALTQAVEYDPRLALAWYYLGEAGRASSRPSDARPAYERCLQLDSDNGRARRALKLLSE